MPSSRLSARLFLVSALALFAELALIRWLGCEVRIFAYFKNLILIACFLGFGAGFYRAGTRARVGGSLTAVIAIVAAVALPVLCGWEYGPQIATRALSNMSGSVFMGDVPSGRAVAFATSALGLGWAIALFLACGLALHGYAQRIGADIDAFGADRRLAAYSWNVGGSLAGILAFALVSAYALPPLAWFLVIVLGTGALLRGRRGLAATVTATVLACVLLWPRSETVWSPYHKLEVSANADGTRTVTVNGTGYMILLPFASRAVPLFDPRVDRWRLPHRLREGADSVLIVGAGAGNDAAAALETGASRVVAVEIDPSIDRLGRRYHPDAPHRDPRLHVVIDDARHYVETTRERFDLIVFSHLDAHTALSGYTNLRLDNYIYTVESFRDALRLLRPGGALFVSFWITQDWVARRLAENLEIAAGRPPVDWFVQGGDGVLQAYYVASDDPAVRARAAVIQQQGNWRPEADAPPPSTDDWPYLFAEKRRVPAPMLLLAIPLLAICMVAAVRLTRSTGPSGAAASPVDRHFFFLGAGFLLLEVHNVSRLALVFGTTWTVNAWVIAGVLVAVLAGNAVIARRPETARTASLYAGLFATLAAAAIVRPGALAALPLGRPAVAALYTLPLFAAGMIFAGSFRSRPDPARALGANILGSILGGFLELASFAIGLSGLLLVAAALYALSWPGSAARRGTMTVRSRPPAAA